MIGQKQEYTFVYKRWPIDYFKRVEPTTMNESLTRCHRYRRSSPETYLYAHIELIMAEVLEPKGLVSCNCINRGDILGSGAFAPATAR